MKSIIEFLVRKLRKKPKFSFDPNFTSGMLCSLIIRECISICRGFKLILFGRLPKMLFLGKGVEFHFLKKIKLGKSVRIGKYSNLTGLGKGYIDIGDHVSIGPFSSLEISATPNNLGAGITIGNGVGIGGHSFIGGAGLVNIGENTIIGQYLSIHPENHRFDDLNTLIKDQGTTRQGISVGKGCWLGAKVTICDGVSIGNHCVIAAGAVVTKSFPKNCVIGGVPAKLLKTIEQTIKIKHTEPTKRKYANI